MGVKPGYCFKAERSRTLLNDAGMQAVHDGMHNEAGHTAACQASRVLLPSAVGIIKCS